MGKTFFSQSEWDDDVPNVDSLENLTKKSKLKLKRKHDDAETPIKSKKKRSGESYVKFESPTADSFVQSSPEKVEEAVGKKNKKKKKQLVSIDKSDFVEAVPVEKQTPEKKLKKNKKRPVELNENLIENGDEANTSDGKKRNKKNKKHSKSSENLFESNGLKENGESENKKKDKAQNEVTQPKGISKNKMKKNKKKEAKEMNGKESEPVQTLKPTSFTVKKSNESMKQPKGISKNKMKKNQRKEAKETDGKESEPVQTLKPTSFSVFKSNPSIKKPKPFVNKLKKMLETVTTPEEAQVDTIEPSKEPDVTLQQMNAVAEKKGPRSLRDRMMERLKGARFRFLNQQMYQHTSDDAIKIFKEDPDAFKAYHEGYQQQVTRWPMNPLDVIIASISKLPKTHIIADLGCGDGRLAKSVPHKVFSFDLVALDAAINVCDMANTPLDTAQVDCAVYCLSLMGTNSKDYIMEANRILKIGGLLKIAEVESRFENVDQFTGNLQKYGFTLIKKDYNHQLFYFMDFRKDNDIKKKSKLPEIALNPCIYKKR